MGYIHKIDACAPLIDGLGFGLMVGLGTLHDACFFPGSAVSPSAVPPSGVPVSTSNVVVSSNVSTASAQLPKLGSGPVPPKFDKSDFQSPTIGELRAIGIGTKTIPGKLDLLVYCPLKGRCPNCKSSLITTDSVGKRKLCYAIPWPKTIVGVDMRCGRCKKHFMTHDTSYVDTLPSEEQVKREFITGKGNGSHVEWIQITSHCMLIELPV